MAQKITFLHIDSFLRNHGTTSDFMINLQIPIFSIKQIRMIALNLPVNNYNVNSSNNTIYFTDGSSNFVGVIPPGVYDIISILPAINLAMMSSGFDGSIDATFSNTDLTITINCNSLISLQFGTFQTNSIANFLGFNNVDTSFSLNNTGNNTIDLSIPPCVFIRVGELPSACKSVSGISGTFPIYITVDSANINFHFDSSNYRIHCEGNISILNQLNISLINPRDGQIFNLNGSDWTMLLELSY